MVKRGVVASTDDDQVLDPVVELVAVDVVHQFGPVESSTEMLLHHEPVLRHCASALDVKNAVALGGDVAVLADETNCRIAMRPNAHVVSSAHTALDSFEVAPVGAARLGHAGSLKENHRRVTVALPSHVVHSAEAAGYCSATTFRASGPHASHADNHTVFEYTTS